MAGAKQLGTQRRGLVAAATALLAVGLSLAAIRAPEAAPAQAEAAAGAPAAQNVLFIVIDTLRADHLSCYGYSRATSPNIDRFATTGVRFERAYTAWPETCESMAAMLSGTWCQTNGVVVDTPQAISTELELLPERFRDAGFRTGAFVMNNVLLKANHFDQGSEQYVEVFNPAQNPRNRSETELACDWMRENAASRFFLWVHLIEPHAPYESKQPERFVGDAWYDPSHRVEVRPPERRFEALGGIPGFSRIGDHDELAYYVARYDSEIVDADAKVGRLLATLEALHLDDRTLVVFVSDHGEGFGEHDYFWHGLVPYDETSHVPLVIRMPGGTPGVASDLVSTVDLAPTILELTGLPPQPIHEGRSLVPQLRDPALPTGRPVFTESGSDPKAWQRSIRDRRFKLIYVPSARERQRMKVDEWSLFDTQADPGERENVLDDYEDVVTRLKSELFAWMRSEPLFKGGPADLSPEELKRIREAGYAGAHEEGDEHGAPPAEDPKSGKPKSGNQEGG